ncbi:MAG TPA: hypothetical protein VG796_19495 [Verrucomicrobiales bacterium]|nr:hypothetical protein [Verrucomicrobiales bacterium]
MKNVHWISLLAIALLSFVMSFITLSGAKDNLMAVPAGNAFTFLGLLSAATAGAVREICKRLDKLEQTKPAKQMPGTIPAEQSGEGNSA